MNERHEKWVQVSPGTVIPAGQPYRVEFLNSSTSAMEFVAPSDIEYQGQQPDAPYFIDSSWKPPLDLPTEPTWGIVLGLKNRYLGKWWEDAGRLIGTGPNNPASDRREFAASDFRDFIPLTDEQVLRIESHHE